MTFHEQFGSQWLRHMRAISDQMQAAFTALERLELPVIALLHGYCLGMGLELALARVEAKLERLLSLVRDARLLARSDLARKALAAYAAARMIPDHLGAAAKTETLKGSCTGRGK